MRIRLYLQHQANSKAAQCILILKITRQRNFSTFCQLIKRKQALGFLLIRVQGSNKIRPPQTQDLFSCPQQGKKIILCQLIEIKQKLFWNPYNIYQKLIMTDDYRFKCITMEDIKEACHTMSESFIKINGIYKKQDSTYEEVYPVFYYQLQHSIKNGLSYVLYLKDKMIGVSINHDMYNYPKLKNTAWLEGQSKLISYERKYVQEIEDELLKSNYEPGIAIYGIYGSILPEYASKGIGLRFLGEMINELKKRNYKVFFGTVASDKALKISLNLGGTIIKEMSCDDPGMQGEKYTFVRADLAKTPPTKSLFERIEPKAKL